MRVDLSFNLSASINAGSRFFLQWAGTGPTAEDLNTFCSDVSTAFGANLAVQMSSNKSLIGVVAVDLTSDSAAEGDWVGTVAGTATGTPLDASACVVINHQITRRYRGGKPRIYLPLGAATVLESQNTWTPAWRAVIKTGWEAFVNAVLALTYGSFHLTNLMNISYYEGVNPPIPLPSGRVKQSSKLRSSAVTDVIVSSTVAEKVGSQRKRLNL